MEKLLMKYHTVSNCFLKKFDQYWNAMLREIDSNQAQLITGNRLRPQICLWGYLATVPSSEVISCDLDYIANVSVSIEMIHKATLLIDDWIDNDNERHGKPAFHMEYNPQYAVVFALKMVGFAMHRLSNIFPNAIVLPQHYYLCFSTIAETIYSLAKGAVEELELRDTDFFNSNKVREIVKLETSEIIGNSMLIGYYVGAKDNHCKQIVEIFKQLGDQCGYLFQALNDLEAFDNPEQLQKHKGNLNYDFSSRRKNLAVATLYAIANQRDKIVLQHANDDELLCLMKKYRVVESLKCQLDLVYEEIISQSAALQSNGLPQEWCEGFNCFLRYVKKFAEKRLRGSENLE